MTTWRKWLLITTAQVPRVPNEKKHKQEQNILEWNEGKIKKILKKRRRSALGQHHALKKVNRAWATPRPIKFGKKNSYFSNGPSTSLWKCAPRKLYIKLNKCRRHKTIWQTHLLPHKKKIYININEEKKTKF